MNARYLATYPTPSARSALKGRRTTVVILRFGLVMGLLAGAIGCTSTPGRKADPPIVTTFIPANGDRTLRVLTRASDATLTPLQTVLHTIGGTPATGRAAGLDYPAAGVLSNPSIEQLPAQLRERMRSYFESSRMKRPSPRLEVTGGAWRLVGPQDGRTTHFELIYRATVKAHVTDLSGRTTLLATEHCSPHPRTLPLSQWQSARFENVRETAIAYVTECSEQVERRFSEIFKSS